MNIVQRVIVEPLEELYEKILHFLPNFLTSLLLVVIGLIAGWILRVFFTRLFRALGIDRHFERFGMGEVLGKGGIKEPLSALLSRIIGWITVLIFLIVALRALDIPSVQRLMEGFFFYLPNVFVAALILLFGYLLSNFLGRAALIAAVNAGMKLSGLVGKCVKFTVVFLSFTMALEQLGVGSNTVVIAFAISFGGVVLALSLALGLGGKEIAKEYLEKKFKGDEKKDEISHL
jgi:hypothetical protein